MADPASPPEPTTEATGTAAPAADLDSMLASAEKAFNESTQTAAPEAADQPPEPEAEATNEEPVSEPTAEAVPDETQEPVDAAEDDTRPLTRREAGRMAQKAAQEALAEKARADAAETQLRETQAKDAEYMREIVQALGSDDDLAKLRAEYDTNADKGLREGDLDSSNKALELKARIDKINDTRGLYAKARRLAEVETLSAFEQQFQQAKTLPGVDANYLATVNNLFDAMKHVSESATKAVETKLKGQMERMKADYEGKLAKAAGRMSNTGEGGRATGGKAVLPNIYGPDGLQTDEAMAAHDAGRLKF